MFRRAIAKKLDAIQAFLEPLFKDGIKNGHYSLSSAPSVKLEELPEAHSVHDYYHLDHTNDAWELVLVDRKRNRITVRSTATLNEIEMSVSAFEELFVLHQPFRTLAELYERGEQRRAGRDNTPKTP